MINICNGCQNIKGHFNHPRRLCFRSIAASIAGVSYHGINVIYSLRFTVYSFGAILFDNSCICTY